MNDARNPMARDWGQQPEPEPVLIDCHTCLMRDVACADCVVSVLLGDPAELSLADDEQRALNVLAGEGMLPPLRLLPHNSQRFDDFP